MKKSSKRKSIKMCTYEQAAAIFWEIQRQWHGQGPESISLTTAQAIKRLGTLMENYKLPKPFKRMVAELREEIIYNTRPKKAKQSKNQPVCSIISIR